MTDGPFAISQVIQGLRPEKVARGKGLPAEKTVDARPKLGHPHHETF
jgi:hypothetical protein